MASAHFDSLLASGGIGGGKIPPLRSRNLLYVRPWNLYQMSSPIGRHEHANFTKFDRIINIDVRN